MIEILPTEEFQLKLNGIEIQIIMEALGEAPFKISSPVLNVLMEQIKFLKGVETAVAAAAEVIHVDRMPKNDEPK